ncbi:hypothetical protein CB1_000802004 [Camelus ferus]|nr:hypothetical protein CB1_000802004 [Camelus ferus]
MLAAARRRCRRSLETLARAPCSQPLPVLGLEVMLKVTGAAGPRPCKDSGEGPETLTVRRGTLFTKPQLAFGGVEKRPHMNATQSQGIRRGAPPRPPSRRQSHQQPQGGEPGNSLADPGLHPVYEGFEDPPRRASSKSLSYRGPSTGEAASPELKAARPLMEE